MLLISLSFQQCFIQNNILKFHYVNQYRIEVYDSETRYMLISAAVNCLLASYGRKLCCAILNYFLIKHSSRLSSVIDSTDLADLPYERIDSETSCFASTQAERVNGMFRGPKWSWDCSKRKYMQVRMTYAMWLSQCRLLLEHLRLTQPETTSRY